MGTQAILSPARVCSKSQGLSAFINSGGTGLLTKLRTPPGKMGAWAGQSKLGRGGPHCWIAHAFAYFIGRVRRLVLWCGALCQLRTASSSHVVRSGAILARIRAHQHASHYY